MCGIPIEHISPAIPHWLLHEAVVVPFRTFKLQRVEGSPDMTLAGMPRSNLAEMRIYLELILLYSPPKTFKATYVRSLKRVRFMVCLPA